MTPSVQRVFRNALHLGSGELLARLCSVTVIILLGHQYGVLVLGAFALAQSMSQYLQPLIDFGLRHVGARLLARYPEAGREIAKRVQKRRVLMAAAVLPCMALYAVFTNLTVDMKIFLVVFATISGFYAISLEWAAWGREQLQLIGFAKAAVPASILVCLVLGRRSSGILWWLVLGNAIGHALQVLTFRLWWRSHHSAEDVQHQTIAAISESLAWQKTSIMGLAWLGNLAFNTIDMLMLGVMANPEQVGLYSAAYRVLNQVLITYYLLTTVVYPQFARQDLRDRVRMLTPRILLPLLAAGIAIAAVVAASRQTVVNVLFGHRFLMACPLLLLLAWAIPLDFLTSWLSNAYIAWGMERRVLVCTAVAAGSNVVLNLVGIPRYGAMAAAVNTLISYAIFLASLAWMGRTSAELTRGVQPQPEATA